MSERLQLTVNDQESGIRLDEFLAVRLGGTSRMRIARTISAGACRVNNAIKEAGVRVFAGDLVEVQDLDSTPSGMTPEQMELDVVYEDDHIIVLVKPSGMLVHPTIGVKTGTLSNALAFHLNRGIYSDSWQHGNRVQDVTAVSGLVRPGIVHRLDRATSGLLAVAKTPHALSVLSRHFRRGLVKKRYLAVVDGGFDETQGSIVSKIGRDPDRRPHWWVMDDGKPAETRWRVLAHARDFTLVELEPVTGRTNQLRIHMASTGRPIVGDALYGTILQPGDEGVSAPPCGRLSGGAKGLLLHAWLLAFHHPETGHWLQFRSHLPAHMACYLATLGIPEPEPPELPV
jgi:23S rRNA pseudouridine1911/1915/1917 synthase